MSKFYNNQKKKQDRQDKQPNTQSNQFSVVRPFNGFPPKPPPSQKSSNIKNNKADPTFPSKPSVIPQQQQHELRQSYLIANRQDEKQSWMSKCCSCSQLQLFKRYYQVTNKDVLKRILMNLTFWQPNFFTTQQNYDFYGPFWIYTTLVFCLSAVPNILLYQGMQSFQYNFQIVGLAFGFVYLQGFLFPIIISFVLNNLMRVNCTYIQNICIYGYSVSVLMIAVLLCSINNCLVHILLLGIALAIKAIFIMNNYNKSYAIPVAKKTLILGLVIGEAALQFFVIKFFFINCIQTAATSTTTQGGQQSHLLENWMHIRTFNA